MAEKFLMPKLSPTMEEGQLSRWLKAEGDAFEANETLAEVDTDKATMEMTALRGGVLLKIIKNAGESASLGEAIAIIGQAGEDFSGILAEIEAAATPPEINKIIEEDGILEVPEAAAVVLSPAEIPEGKFNAPANGRMLVSPIAARMASENGIDLRGISGSGPNGRIIKRDIEIALAAPPKEAAAPAAIHPAQITGPASYREVNTTPMRRTIAERLAQSLGPIPTFYLTVDIEMDNTLELRKQINSERSEDTRISVNDIIVKVAAMSLLKHPFVNASYQDKTIRFYEDADIGVAVAIDEGLITPIVRSANKKGFAQISEEIKEMANRAKEKRLQPEEYTGATFSISNLGMLGIREFTAIINPPEAAILAIGASAQMPVARNGEVVIRNMMTVTMSCDHRVIDGATGARFLQTFKQLLENPAMLLL